MKKLRKLTALLLAVCFCFAGCGGKAGEGRATTMRLDKTEGAVSVWDEKAETVGLQERLPLYSGYSVHTDAASYGWIDLDDTKLAKLDERSTVSIQKENRYLRLTLDEGNLFFHVTKPLGKDETMEIRVSDMIVGIRGTCGWVEDAGAVYILEGTVTCESPSAGISAQVSAGEMAYLAQDAENRIEVRPFSGADIPDYVWTELDDTILNSLPEALAEDLTGASAAETNGQEGSIYTLPMSAEELRNLLSGDTNQPVIIRAGANDNTLVIDSFATVYGHLILEEGVSLSVVQDTQLNINGTLEVHSDVVNDGFIWILEEGVLQVDGAFTNTGRIVNGDVYKGMEEEGPVEAQNSRITAAQGIESTGYLDNVGAIEGTVTVNGGYISLSAGNVDRLILNDGTYMDEGGACGEFVQNGGNTMSAAGGDQ